jgi:hypothetical protein
LDDKETKLLMKECLKAQKGYLPAQIDSLLEVAIQIALDMAKSMGLTGTQLKAAEKEIRTQFASVKKKLVVVRSLSFCSVLFCSVLFIIWCTAMDITLLSYICRVLSCSVVFVELVCNTSDG